VEFQDLADVGQTGYHQLSNTACQLTVLDSLALVADSLRGLRILDLSALRHLAVADAWQGADTAYAVLTDDSLRYACLAAGYDGVRIFSIADPLHPAELGWYQPGSRVYQVSRCTVDTVRKWSDSLLCVAAGDSGLVLLDLADPALPRECARVRSIAPVIDVSMGFYTALLPDTTYVHHGPFVDTVYIDTIRIVALARGDSSVWFFKITDSLSLMLLGPIQRDHPVFNVNVSGCDFYTSGGHAVFDYCGIKAVDTLRQFSTRATALTGGWVRNHTTRLAGFTPIAETLAFYQGSHIRRHHDVMFPGPVEGARWNGSVCDGQHGLHYQSRGNLGLAHFTTPGQCRDAATAGIDEDYMPTALLVADGTAGLKVADLSQLNELTEMATAPVMLSSGALATGPRHAYVSSASPGLRALDLSDSSRPMMTSYTPLPSAAFGLATADSLLLAAVGDSGLQVFSLANADTPALIGGCRLPGFALSVTAGPGYACVAADSAGLAIVGLGDPAHPQLLGRYESPGTAFGVAIDTAHRRAVVADGMAGVAIVDITNLAAPALIGSCATAGVAFDAAVQGSLAYVADGGYGLLVLDISDPARPAPAGSLITGGYARQLALRDSIVFLADGEGGLRVINIGDPRHPAEVGNYQPGRQVWSVAPFGECVLALDDAAAVRLLWPYWTSRRPYQPPLAVITRFENRPNPFIGQTWIQYRLEQQGEVNLSVYNIAGQLVATLAAGQQPAGDHRVSWNGKDGQGRRLANGVYLCRLLAGSQAHCRTLVLVR
jgi:hypothetical protein